jgi:pimeloyl-ACP methyl ester carboxylesterase
LVVVLACAGAAYQWIAHNRDVRQNPRPGQLVDVGGYRMHLYCMGQGSPTVVLDSGLGDTWLVWYKVQPPIAQFTRVCSYDHAGLGWSDPSPNNRRTSRVIAEELHTLLHNAGMTGPFVLAGHSMGGLSVRMYTSLFPTEVAGVILVDSTHPDLPKRFPPEVTKFNAGLIRRERLMVHIMPIGIPRLLGWCGNGPAGDRAMLRTVNCTPGHWREHLAEHVGFDESADEVREAGTLGSIPLVVLSHDPERAFPMPRFSPEMAKEKDRLWDETQGELAQLSTDSSRVVAKGSGHYIQVDRPDLVVEAVKKLVEQARK